MTKTIAELLAGEDMEGGELFCDDIYNFLKNQGKDLNLLTNSGFGVWSQSDANKGLGTMNYDSGSVAPVVGETLTGATSGAVGKVISYTLTGGTWGGGNAAGAITLGACNGRFNDNENINGSVGGANILTVNEPNTGVGVDLIQNGEFETATTGWTAGNATLASIAGGQVGNCLEVTRTAGNLQWGSVTFSSLTAGKIYKLSVYVKSGTSGNEAFNFDVDEDGIANRHRFSGTSSAAWVLYTFTFESDGTENKLSLVKNTATAGTMLFDEVTIYEIIPCCTGANNVAFDGWYKDTTVDAYREHNDGGTNTKDGSFYSLKIVGSTAGDYLYWPLNAIIALGEHLQRFAGRTVTFGCWIKTSTASHTRLRISDGVSSDSYSSYHTGGGAWEWLEVSHSVNATPTQFLTSFRSELAGAVDGDTIVYISQPMLVFGSCLGENMYQPRLQEEILIEKAIPSNLLNALLSQNDIAVADLNIEADSDAMLPKGCKAVKILTQCNDVNSHNTDCYLRFRVDAVKDYEYYNSPYGLTTDADKRLLGWQQCDANGDIDYNLESSGAGNFDVDICKYVAVRVN